MAGSLVRVEANKVPIAAPYEAFVGNQVLQEEEGIVVQAELPHVEFHHAFLGVVHVHVAHAEDHVFAGLLGIDHQLVIGAVVEVEVVVFLQGDMFLTGGVHAAHEVLDTRATPVVNLVLVLFAVLQFFLDGARNVFAELVAMFSQSS